MSRLPATLTTLAFVVLTTSISAQKDEIQWVDGKTTTGAKITDYNAREIKFRAGGSNQTRGSHEVKSVRAESWSTVLARYAGDPAGLVGEAQGQKDKLIAQACLHQAAVLYRGAQKTSDEFAVLREILEKTPASRWAPLYYQRRIQHYVGRAKPQFKDAAAAAEKYQTACTQNAWSEAFALDAELWKRRIQSATSKNVDQFITELKDIIGRAGNYPMVAAEANVDLADAYRTKKDYAEARKAYEAILETKNVSPDVLARTYNGLGYIHLEDAINSKGDQAASAKAYHAAFRTFLKVYVNCEGANANNVAEGLYNASKACEQWNGMPQCKKMAGVLRGRLRLRAPYKDTYWAQKK